MAIDIGTPPVAENVESSVESPAEDVGDKGKKRGRVKAADDPRQEFVCTEDMVNEGGKIKEWPEDCGYVYGGESRCHRPIKKDLFASEEVYIDYRVGAKRYLIDAIEDDIKLMLKSRDQFNSIENLETRSKMKKAQKLRNQIRALWNQCEEDGLTVEDFMSEED